MDAQFSSTTEYEQITDRKVAGFDKVNVDYEVYCGGEEVEEKRRCIVALGSEGLGRIFDVLIGVAPGESKRLLATCQTIGQTRRLLVNLYYLRSLSMLFAEMLLLRSMMTIGSRVTPSLARLPSTRALFGILSRANTRNSLTRQYMMTL